MWVRPHSHDQTLDGKWVAIARTNDAMFARLAAAMDQPDLASTAKFGPKDKRLERSSGWEPGWVSITEPSSAICSESMTPNSPRSGKVA
jgi:CoA-transferase family III